MSSHHVVREKQEPALLVLGMAHFTDELLGQLLEWSPTVIATQTTAEILNIAGIKIDVIIGSEADAENFQSDIKYIRASDNPTHAALSYLIANNYPAVNIVTDVFAMDDYLPFADRINLVIYSGNQKIYPVNSGFSKWKPAGDAVSLMNPVTGLQTAGLTRQTENYFTTTADGFFSLQFEQPFVFIAEDIL